MVLFYPNRLKTVNDIHTSAIVSLRFLNDKNQVLSADLSVCYLSIYLKNGGLGSE